MNMDAANTVEALGALAHQHRLAIYRLLVEAGPEGMSAGDIADRIGLVPSSLTFHVQSLQRAGLITQRRLSRQLFYSADFGTMNELVDYLTKNCCGGVQTCAPACRPAIAAKPNVKSRRTA
jgi:ArsR family transcriptional regulator, arsenate/arsenite/antimonite-responsive transcriptional repressor